MALVNEMRWPFSIRTATEALVTAHAGAQPALASRTNSGHPHIAHNSLLIFVTDSLVLLSAHNKYCTMPSAS
eukprot:6208896-Pleurochrysis_carterae.AAC.2